MGAELPAGWRWDRLGKMFKRVARKNTAGITRVLTASGEHGLIDQGEFFNKRVAARDISGYFHLKRGEFAYNRSSMAGYPYGAIKRLERYSDGALSTLYLCFALRKPEALDPDFASHLLDSGQLDSELAPIARVGARAHGLLNVTPAEFFEIQCSIPPLPEQKKIAAILGAVDAAIQATQAVIDQTRRVKAGLLQTLLTRGIGHTRFKKTAIGEIPESWAITTPGELANFTGGNGFRPKDWSDSGRPIIRIQNLNGSQQFNYYDGPVNPRWLIPPGELLFAWAGSAGASFGPTIWPGPEGVLNQHIYRITPRRGVVKRWLYYILQLVTGRIEARAHGFKTTLLHVHKSDITDQPIPLPPAEEQAQIVSRLMTAEQSEEHAMSALTALQKTKAGLLQDLLTGAVRVTP